MPSQIAWKSVPLFLVVLSLLTCTDAGASHLPDNRQTCGVPTRVSVITSTVVEESGGPSPGMQTRGSVGLHSHPNREIGAVRFWLPDTLETPWTAADKKLHFLACYSIVLTGRVSSGETVPGIVGAVALSVAKELWDLWFKIPPSHRGISKRDLIADAVGIGVAVVIIEWFGE